VNLGGIADSLKIISGKDLIKYIRHLLSLPSLPPRHKD
jgi:hypothetical protein